MRLGWLWSARANIPLPRIARVASAPSAFITHTGVGVSSRSRRSTHHLWRFDARRDARLASQPKALALWHAAGLLPPQQPPRKPRRPSPIIIL